MRTSSILGMILIIPAFQLAHLTIGSQYAAGITCDFELTQPKLASIDARSIAEATLGQHFVILTTISNNCSDQDQPFTVIIEARNSKEQTEYLGWQNGAINSSTGSAEVAIQWDPTHAGDYELRAFAINGFESPVVLSKLMKETVTVNKEVSGPASPDADEAFTIILIPDTQHYFDTGKEELAYNQTKWIAKNKEELDIRLVIHLGDIVENYNRPSEWVMADKMMKILEDSRIPYLALAGNHDFAESQSFTKKRSYVQFQKYFPDKRLIDNQPLESKKITTNATNMYTLLTVGNNEFLVVSMEYCPTMDVVKQVSEVIKENADKRVILATHAFLRTDGNRHSATGGGVCPRIEGVSKTFSTEALWDNIVYPNPNVFLVVSGHSSGENNKIDYNSAGKPVEQVVIDYQTRNNGMLKIVTFEPEKDVINFQTYSPWLDSYPSGAKAKFTFEYDMN